MFFLKALREAGCGNEKRLMPDEEQGLAAYKKQKGILRREGAPKNGTWVILWKEKKRDYEKKSVKSKNRSSMIK